MTDHIFEESLLFHAQYKGKISIESRVPINNQRDLSLAYTPGVAQPCLEIQKDKNKAYTYTSKGNLVAVITNGTAVLGLGDIGPEAAMPVMEGKAILFKRFANVDSIPLCINTKDPDEFCNIVEKIAPSFGGINLEDIAAPHCFEIEERLKKRLDIPVFHDDQHGTAIVVLAALINALEIAGKEFKNTSVVINGAGAAGIAIAKLLHSYGIGEIMMCDRTGLIFEGRKESMLPHKVEIAKMSNKSKRQGSLADALKGADVFVGVSQAGVVSKEMVRSMAMNPIILALANPIPEILPSDAKEAGALVVCTGRSDFPNQVNNALAFPGLFRGALDARAKDITEEMKQAAAHALAEFVPGNQKTSKYVIPKIFDPGVAAKVAEAVEKAAMKSSALV